MLFQRSPEALFSSIGEDVVALHVQKGQAYGMQDVTADLWRMLADPVSIDGLCAGLEEIYEVDPETCRRDVSQVMTTFEKEGLVLRVGG